MELFPRKMCRICEKKSNLVNISSNQIYIKQFLACADVTFDINDRLPQYFCRLCATRLTHAYQLKQQCEETQRKLEDLLTFAENNQQELYSTYFDQTELDTKANDDDEFNYENQKNEKSENDETIMPSMFKETKLTKNHDIYEYENTLKKRHKISKTTEKKCIYCSKMISIKKYAKHMKTHYKKIYNCELCFLQFIAKNDLLAHTKNFHQLTKPYQCDICNQTFSLKPNLKRHFTSVHFNTKEFPCNICNKSYKFPYLLRDHKISHLSPDERKKFRKKTYAYESSYKLCSLCGKNIKDSSYKQHLQWHSDERPFECNICGRRFRAKPTYVIHLRTHTGDKPFKCSFCDMRFPQQANLQTHENMHKNVKPYKCDMCEMEFKQSQQLVTHKRVHTGEKPFKCEYCGKEFAVKANCRIHMRLHTGEKPFKCELCADCFIDLNGLKRHRKKMHTVQ